MPQGHLRFRVDRAVDPPQQFVALVRVDYPDLMQPAREVEQRVFVLLSHDGEA